MQKLGIIEGVKLIPEDQETELIYHLGHELTGDDMTIEEYQKEISSITKDEIIEFASKINIDIIYFLRN